MEYLNVTQARDLPGMRLVLSRGAPGPWAEAAKAIFAYKQIDYVAVAQEVGEDNPELQAWTGQTSAPVAILDDLPPAVSWLDTLLLVERVYPRRPLLPVAVAERARVIGLSNEIAGTDGFGWNRRLQMIAPAMDMDPPPPPLARLAQKYGFSPQALAQATGRMQAITACLDQVLRGQQVAGSAFFVGDQVSALDFYWANFAGLLKPLPAELNPMPSQMRGAYEMIDEATARCLTPALEAHRDMMYDTFIATPLDF